MMVGLSTRRQLVLGSFGSLATACAGQHVGRVADELGRGPGLLELEAKVGGRLGVFAIDTGSGSQLSHRPDERFAMCSTFKWVLAAAVLARVDRAELSLHDRVTYGLRDLLEYAPSTREHVTPRHHLAARDGRPHAQDPLR